VTLNTDVQAQNSKGTSGLLTHVKSTPKLTVQQKITKALTPMQHNHWLATYFQSCV